MVMMLAGESGTTTVELLLGRLGELVSLILFFTGDNSGGSAAMYGLSNETKEG